MYSCIYCGRYNHESSKCYYKNINIKNITRGEDGKLKKIYGLKYERNARITISPQRRNTERDNYKERSPISPPRRERSKTPDTRHKSPKKEVKKITFANKERTKRSKTPEYKEKCQDWMQKSKKQQSNDLEVVAVIPPGISTIKKVAQKKIDKIQPVGYMKCNKCLNWELQLHQKMKIIDTLTKEVFDLREEMQSYKTLYRLSQKQTLPNQPIK